MRRLIDLGVEGIITDHPARLRRAVQEAAARRLLPA
jgi:glycerophosphoryl diester phosphodiesterase